MTRRKFSREFKLEAVKLVTERGVSVAQACRDLELAESVLRRWMRELTAAPAAAFPGNGQIGADLAEIAALKKEVARLRAERDILKIGEPCAPLVRAQWRTLFSRGRRHEVRLHRKAPPHLADQLAL
jgi:transposase